MVVKKRLLCVMLALVIGASAFMLSACQSYKWGPVEGGQPDAAVESNGGYAVKQGDYLYFVNGKVGFPEDPDIKYNYFGKAEKGSIMRAKIDGSTLGEPQIVVPKNIMSNYADGGFWIFGNWIYYVSPTTGVNNKKELQTEYLDYMRTRIDGTKTQKIATLKGQALEYKFTADGMVYFIDNAIKRIPCDDKKVGKETVVAEEVTGKLFPSNTSYTPGKTSIADYVFYTKAGEDENLPGNELWAVDSKGNKTCLYNQKTNLADGEDPYKNMGKIETLTLAQSRVCEDGVEIYYSKSVYAGGSNETKGVFGRKLTDALDFKSAAETRFTLESQTSFYPISLSEGIFITGSTPFLAKPMTGFEAQYDKETYKNLGSVTVIDIRRANLDGEEGFFIFYIADSLYTCAPLYASQNINAKVLCDDKADTSFFKPDVVGGYLYYIASDKLSYTARVSIAGGEEELLGKMTETDQKTWDEKQKEENKNA